MGCWDELCGTMPTTKITYVRFDRSEDVYHVHQDEDTLTYHILSDETIEHEDYNDLCRKIKNRFKELLNIQHEPLFDLCMQYFLDYERDRFTEHFTQQLYDSLDWYLQEDKNASFQANYFTYRGVDDGSSSNDGSDSSVSVESLGVKLDCAFGVLSQLDLVLDKLN